MPDDGARPVRSLKHRMRKAQSVLRQACPNAQGTPPTASAVGKAGDAVSCSRSAPRAAAHGERDEVRAVRRRRRQRMRWRQRWKPGQGSWRLGSADLLHGLPEHASGFQDDNVVLGQSQDSIGPIEAGPRRQVNIRQGGNQNRDYQYKRPRLNDRREIAKKYLALSAVSLLSFLAVIIVSRPGEILTSRLRPAPDGWRRRSSGFHGRSAWGAPGTRCWSRRAPLPPAGARPVASRSRRTPSPDRLPSGAMQARNAMGRDRRDDPVPVPAGASRSG